MLQLTSYNRMLRYLSSAAGSPLTDTKAQKQMIVNWILAASKQIETFLGRWLAISAYTEYFDTPTEKDVEFFVRGYPITILTDVYLDGDSEWDGSGESEITDCYINKHSNGVVLPSQPAIRGRKTIRIRYTGGLAYNGVRSVFAIASSSGTWSVGKFVAGGTSEAVGIIKAATATTLTVEILYGIFEAGETVTEYTDEDLTVVGDANATLSSISQQSLVETYPDIIRAAEIQVRHYWKHKDDFELTGTSRDATNRRIDLSDEQSSLTREATKFLIPYRNTLL